MTTILVTENRAPANDQLGDMEDIAREILGEDSKIIYEYSIPACAEHIKNGRAHGLVIPHGHGDHTAIDNLRRYVGELEIPVLKAYRNQRESGSFRTWLEENFSE